MAIFTFYVRDDRYDVPTREFVITQSEERARVRAVDRLLESPHHTAIEVYQGQDLRFSLTAGPRAHALH